MDDNNNDGGDAIPPEQFYRQRRNLVLTAAIILFINVTRGELSVINILGNELRLGNPAALPWLLLIVLGYFFLRFAQYAHEIRDKGFRRRFFRRAERALEPRLLRREYKKGRFGTEYKLRDLEVYGRLAVFDPAMPKNTGAMSVVPKGGGAILDMNEMSISNAEMAIPFIKAGFYVLLRTRLATDYLMPAALALIAVGSFVFDYPSLFVERG